MTLANDVLVDAFDRIQQIVHKTVEGLDEASLTYRPAESANTIAWLVWHLTRVQDDHIAGLAGDQQVWQHDWAQKLELPFDTGATGYGQSADEIAAVKASAEQLLGYHDAVHKKSVAYIKSLQETDYQKVVDTNWDPPVTLLVRLVSVVSDDLQHAGQAAYVKGLLTMSFNPKMTAQI